MESSVTAVNFRFAILFVVLVLESVAFAAKPQKSKGVIEPKVVLKQEPEISEKKKWYSDTSAGLALDINRQEQLNQDDADYKAHYGLFVDHIWQQKWLGGLQYSFASDSTSSGSIKIDKQSHQFLLRGLFQAFPLQNSGFWTGLSAGYEKERLELSVGGNKQTRWSNWSWVLIPEVSYRHPLFKNFWMQESLAYSVRQYQVDGELMLALRFGVDLSIY